MQGMRTGTQWGPPHSASFNRVPVFQSTPTHTPFLPVYVTSHTGGYISTPEAVRAFEECTAPRARSQVFSFTVMTYTDNMWGTMATPSAAGGGHRRRRALFEGNQK
jgi:hypothetical protein